ncbi:MAG: hypothetical protein GEV11_27220 [Streptosporangiales bacterium]|nr:hypothetical protein [Streptosporangiales bacterium]
MTKRSAPLMGGAPRAVWTTTGTDPRIVSARSAAQILVQSGTPTHLVWNPLSGEIVQLLPATVPAGDLCRTAPETGGDPSLHGRVCLQIAVVGLAARPFTDEPMLAAEAIVAWLDSWHVPRSWQGGQPGAAPAARDDRGSVRLWGRGGNFGHSQVPGTRTAAPGRVDIALLTGIAQVPRPRVETTPAPLPTARLSEVHSIG